METSSISTQVDPADTKKEYEGKNQIFVNKIPEVLKRNDDYGKLTDVLEEK